MHRKAKLGLAFGLAFFGISGCDSTETSNPGLGGEDGHAYLSILGENDLIGEDGDIHALVVRYHDAEGEPLAGVVYFRIQGDAGSTTLSRRSTVTDDDGIATVDLELSGSTSFEFKVIAEAEGARDASWSIALTTVPLDPTGAYRVESRFELPNGPPPADLTGLDILADAVDDPFDPATWLLDAIESNLGAPFGGLLAVARAGGVVDSEMNDILAADSPAFASRMYAANHRVREIASTLGLASELRVDDAAATRYRADHALSGWIYWLDGVRYLYSEDQLDLSLGVTEPVDVLIEKSRKIALNRHAFEIPYGDALWFGIENVVVPSVDPYATTLSAMMTRSVDCDAVGASLADKIGTGGSTLYQMACTGALLSRAEAIRASLIDTEATLIISGDADMIDNDDDRIVDELGDGSWTGLLVFPSDGVDLEGAGQEFSGTRIGD